MRVRFWWLQLGRRPFVDNEESSRNAFGVRISWSAVVPIVNGFDGNRMRAVSFPILTFKAKFGDLTHASIAMIDEYTFCLLLAFTLHLLAHRTPHLISHRPKRMAPSIQRSMLDVHRL